MQNKPRDFSSVKDLHLTSLQLGFVKAVRTTMSTRTPKKKKTQKKNRFNEQKQSICACLLHQIVHLFPASSSKQQLEIRPNFRLPREREHMKVNFSFF